MPHDKPKEATQHGQAQGQPAAAGKNAPGRAEPPPGESAPSSPLAPPGAPASQPPASPQASPPQQAQQSAGPASGPGIDLINYLKSSGTPPGVLKPTEDWMQGSPGATAEDAFRHLQDQPDNVNVGTLRKAGKWLYGAEFEPERAASQAPAEEVKGLRVQIARLEDELATARAHLSASQRRELALETERDRLRQESAVARKTGRRSSEGEDKDNPGVRTSDR